MTMPYYVAPEQIMKDRAEYAQKGIARGKSLVATIYSGGILIVAENPSRSLHKISEIYDRIAFAGVGRYNEYDQLRVAGVRHADTKGLHVQPRGRRCALVRERLRAVPRAGLHPRDEAARSRDPRSRARRAIRSRTSCTTSPTRGRSQTRTSSRCSVATPTRSSTRCGRWRGVTGPSTKRSRPLSERSRVPTGRSVRGTSRWRS